MKFAAIDEHRDEYSLKVMCKAMEVSKSGYHAWQTRSASQRTTDNFRLVRLIEKIHLGSRGTYGSPRIHAYLIGMGETCSEPKIARLMKAYGIRAKAKRKFKATTNSKHRLPIASNVLNRNFNPTAPNKSWAGDITYLWTKEGWLYLAVVLDLYSRKVVGWAMEPTLSRELVLNALKMAISQRQPSAGLISHSDQGVQYASNDYQALLNTYGIACSMSRKGNCWDNSVVESFFGSLKQEHIFFCDFMTRDEARNSVFEWIEGFYNRERLHSTLGFLSPEQYERKMKVA
jgi:putative transposase